MAAFLAMVLSMVGLYGVIPYGVMSRRKELGLRLALGARPGAVRMLVIRETLPLVAVGVAIGLAGALAPHSCSRACCSASARTILRRLRASQGYCWVSDSARDSFPRGAPHDWTPWWRFAVNERSRVPRCIGQVCRPRVRCEITTTTNAEHTETADHPSFWHCELCALCVDRCGSERPAYLRRAFP